MRGRFGDLSSTEDRGTHIIALLLESAILGRDEDTTEALARRLEPLAPCPCSDAVVSYARLLGGAAALLGKREAGKNNLPASAGALCDHRLSAGDRADALRAR